MLIRAKWRLGGKEFPKACHRARVSSFRGQAGVIEELKEGLGGWVAVRNPQHDHLFQQDLAVGCAFRAAFHVSINGGLPAVNAEGREFRSKLSQGAVQLALAQVFF
jgi:hypothetical protein